MKRLIWQIWGASTILFLLAVLVFLGRYGALMDFRDWLASDEWATTTLESIEFDPQNNYSNYSFTVDGQTYTNTRTHFFERLVYRESAVVKNKVLQTPSQTVLYAPATPERAVLVRELPTQKLFGLLIGAFFAYCTLFIPFGLIIGFFIIAYRGGWQATQKPAKES